MFTECPSCNRQFRIRAQQISAAEGTVKCGYCGQQFNALQRLYDKPRLLKDDLSLTDNVDDNTVSEPQFFIPTAPGNSNDVGESWTEASSANIDGISEGKSVDRSTVFNSTEEELSIQPKRDYALPQQLLEDQYPQPGLVTRFFWSFGTLILLVIMITQLAWFNRDELLRRYPVLAPNIVMLCEQFNCSVIRHKDISALKLVNRDVRVHPRYKDTLLINATMSNTSYASQPFPRVQLTLFDTEGKLKAYREFYPNDYLDGSIDTLKGMLPDTPVHFVLEVIGPTKDVVSFEFRFL